MNRKQRREQERKRAAFVQRMAAAKVAKRIAALAPRLAVAYNNVRYPTAREAALVAAWCTKQAKRAATTGRAA